MVPGPGRAESGYDEPVGSRVGVTDPPTAMSKPTPISAAEAAARLRPIDRLGIPLGPGQPKAFLRALGDRDDWQDLTVFGALLVELFPLFAKPGVRMRSGFFGPAERALRAAGHAVEFVPADFRRFREIAERFAARVVATAAAPPDEDGQLSLSLHAGATVEEAHAAARDPERLLVVETSPAYPRTRGLAPDHPHRIPLSAVDVWWAAFAALVEPLPEELCPMNPGLRATYTVPDGPLRDALDPALIAHRDRIYAEHLELPVRT